MLRKLLLSAAFIGLLAAPAQAKIHPTVKATKTQIVVKWQTDRTLQTGQVYRVYVALDPACLELNSVDRHARKGSLVTVTFQATRLCPGVAYVGVDLIAGKRATNLDTMKLRLR